VPKVVIVHPTLQNPTTRTMSLGRRRDLVEVARRLDLAIVEDAAYEPYADPDGRPSSLADLAPERTFHILSTSKSLATGLRVGFILAPDQTRRGGLIRGIRAIGYSPPAWKPWCSPNGSRTGRPTPSPIGSSRRRAPAWTSLAGSWDRPMEAPGAPRSPHVWLPMPPLEAERLAARAFRSGVEVTPPDAPVVAPGEVSGVRLCLGAAPDRRVLEEALTTVAAILSDGAPSDDRAIV